MKGTRKVSTRVFTTRSGNKLNQAYLYNPEKDSYGWYNIDEDYITSKGRELEEAIAYSHDFNSDVGTLEDRLRTNIEKVLDTDLKGKAEDIGLKNNYGKFVNLYNAMSDKLDSMSALEIYTFAQQNGKYINLFFEYKEHTHGDYSDLNARVIKLAEALGVDYKKYVDADAVPESVQQKLINLEGVSDLESVKFE